MFLKARDDLVIQKSLHATQVTTADLSVAVWIAPLGADCHLGGTEKGGCIRQNLSFSFGGLSNFKLTFLSLSQNRARGYEDSVKSEPECTFQLLQDNTEIRNPNQTLIGGREWAGEVRKLGREGHCWTQGYKNWQRGKVNAGVQIKQV